VEIYVAAVQALRKNERQDKTQFYNQNWWFSSEFQKNIGITYLIKFLFWNIVSMDG
jgi:hypothetical protein